METFVGLDEGIKGTVTRSDLGPKSTYSRQAQCEYIYLFSDIKHALSLVYTISMLLGLYVVSVYVTNFMLSTVGPDNRFDGFDGLDLTQDKPKFFFWWLIVVIAGKFFNIFYYCSELFAVSFIPAAYFLRALILSREHAARKRRRRP